MDLVGETYDFSELLKSFLHFGEYVVYFTFVTNFNVILMNVPQRAMHNRKRKFLRKMIPTCDALKPRDVLNTLEIILINIHAESLPD